MSERPPLPPEPATDQVREWINQALTPLPGEVVGMPFWPWIEDEDDA